MRLLFPFDRSRRLRSNIIKYAVDSFNLACDAGYYLMKHRENGKIVPIVISQWYKRATEHRFYGSKLFEIEFE